MAFMAMKMGSAGEGVDQTEVANFAKSIDHTKSDSPSVPQERLNRSMGGRRPAPGK